MRLSALGWVGEIARAIESTRTILRGGIIRKGHPRRWPLVLSQLLHAFLAKALCRLVFETDCNLMEE